MEPITVVIPIGPDPAYLEYLPECVESVLNQTHKPDEIVFVNDGAQLDLNEITQLCDGVDVQYYKTLWNVGVPDAFNFGIALSRNNLVFTIGSDDIMRPTCLEECAKAYDKHKIEGWYSVTYEVQSGTSSWLPNNTAMVTKKLWELTGGFPPAAGIGGCDALLLSALTVHAPERIILVKQYTPLCWLREGPHQDTRKSAAYFSDVLTIVRDKVTQDFKFK